MALPSRTRPKRPWLPWVRLGLVVLVVAGVGYGALEIAQRYLGLQKLTIEQITVTGCRGERQVEIQTLAEKLCLKRPLFWFDAERLRREVEERRWVRGLLIRRDPPDRLSLVVDERKPLLWVVRPSGVYLMADDGVILDPVSQANLAPIPVVADPDSQQDASLVELIRVATRLRTLQGSFYDRVNELRMGPTGPMVFIEGLSAPILLSRNDPTKNIPNFQGLFLDQFAKRPDIGQIRYFDLRWDDEIAVGNPDPGQPPVQKAEK
nr:FtsQ-type POTRA domain-containing protein [uncultured Holophaga sp.]